MITAKSEKSSKLDYFLKKSLQYDIYGAEVKFNIGGKPKINSYLGVFGTFLTFLVVLIYFVKQFQILIYH